MLKYDLQLFGGRGNAGERASVVYENWTDKDAKREYSKYDYDVTSKEWADSTMYTGGRYYSAIQRALYTGKMRQTTYLDGVQDMSPYIQAIDNSMRPLSSNVELSRSISYDNWEKSVGVDLDTIQKITEAGSTDLRGLNKAIGKSFSMKGYVSTSYNENQNAAAGSQVMIKFETPKGTKAVVTSNRMESEVILHRNLDYRITGYEIKTIAGTRKQIVFKARVLN